jgi:hypothetical protein
MKSPVKIILRYINPGELFFDIIIFLSVSFFYELIVAPGKTILDSYDINILLFIIVIIEFIVIFYLGTLKFLLFIIINGMFLIMLVTISVFKILPLKSLGGDAEFVILLILTAPFLMALFASFDLDDIDDVTYLFYIPGMILFLAIPITAIVIGYRFHWYLGILALPGIILILISPYIIKHLIKRIVILNDNKNFRILKSGMRNLLLPVVVALALAFWHEFAFKAIIQSQINNKMPITTNFTIGFLFLSGLIPVRIMAALEPPYKILNTIIGLGVFLYFFWEMLQYIKTL